ncbi:hypothetical protein, partial [Marinobacter sp.]|uniref:hypothetical protein n=1 Tax=Marinobacter sp. TaxID=50741 RepID=UPI0023537F90
MVAILPPTLVSGIIEPLQPVVTFRESLYLERAEYRAFEYLLRRLLYAIAQYKFDFAQANPDLFEQLKLSTDQD